MFSSFGRRRVTPSCHGPPGFNPSEGEQSQASGSEPRTQSEPPTRSTSTLVKTGEMVLSPNEGAGVRRRSIDLVSEHLKSTDKSLMGSMPAGKVVTKHNAKQHMLVVRGPHWRWGEDDGGAGKPGRILCVDKKAALVTVFWHHTDNVHGYYRCGKQHDLSIAVTEGIRESVVESADVSSYNSEEEDNVPKGALQRMLMVFPRRNSVLSLLSQGDSARRRSSAASGSWNSNRESTIRDSTTVEGFSTMFSWSRRSSQADFSTASQTFIVFDWDDTLFPTSYFAKGLGLNPTIPLKDQKKLAPAVRPQVGRGLMKCADNAIRLLRLASTMGKVVLVTLADNPWVELTCRSSYPMVGQVLKELGIKVVYAKEVCKDRLRRVSRPDGESEFFWGKIKGECIAREAQDFYSQYEGQSWKNIISIGDSHFERLGTMVTTSEYMREKGLLSEHDEVDAQEFKVRTKTLKMVGEPTLEELTCELDMLIRWLPMMVTKDSSLDVIIDDLDNPSQVKDIEEMLAKKSPPPPPPPAVAGFANGGEAA